jgi:hypothetical protein
MSVSLNCIDWCHLAEPDAGTSALTLAARFAGPSRQSGLALSKKVWEFTLAVQSGVVLRGFMHRLELAKRRLFSQCLLNRTHLPAPGELTQQRLTRV